MTNNTIEKYARDLNILELTRGSSLAKAVENINFHQREMAKSFERSMPMSRIREAALASQQAMRLSVNSSLLDMSRIREATLASQQAMDWSVNSSLLESTVQNIIQRPQFLLTNAEQIAKIANNSNYDDMEAYNSNTVEQQLEEINDKFSSVEDDQSIIRSLEKLPALAKVFTLMFNKIFFILFMGISVNLLTPIVENYLENNNLSDREKIRDVKKLPSFLLGVRTSDLRFITNNNIIVREKPSVKSKILAELMLGQVITVLSKERNWIEVIYEYENGESVIGWVFTRYTSRFSR